MSTMTLSTDLTASLPEAQLLELFPIPVLTYQWPDGTRLAAELRGVIMERMSQTPGVQITNQGGGWHSETDLQEWRHPCVEDLKRRMLLMVREVVRRTTPNAGREHLEGWKIEAWANVNGCGASNRSHEHVGGNNMWSGIFYVDTGGVDSSPALGGLTKLEDRSGVPKEVLVNSDPFEREYTAVPQTGTMLLFPASLRHHVQTYRGRNQRVTIAFNLKHTGFVMPTYPDQLQAKRWWWKNFRGFMYCLERLKRMLGIKKTAFNEERMSCGAAQPTG